MLHMANHVAYVPTAKYIHHTDGRALFVIETVGLFANKTR